MTPAASATRIVRSVPAVMRSRAAVQDVGQEAAELGDARRELEAPVAELDDRDRREERALPGRVGLDVALDERRVSAGRRAARSSSRASRSVAGLVAQAATGAAVQDRGRGGECRPSRSDCTCEGSAALMKG